MTPWELSKDTEHSQQRALFSWANCAAQYGFAIASDPRGYSINERCEIIGFKSPVPELELLFAIHNQGHGDAIRGARAKAEGVKAGVPDLMLPVPIGMRNGEIFRDGNVCIYGLFIEMKVVGKKGVVSGKQSDWGEKLQQQGYGFRICRGWIEAANDISYYLGSTVRVS
jgi:VRR-NUC domain